MRFLATFLIAIVATLSSGQSEKPHGKTDAQILKMGMVAWSNYYTDHVGGSTADMSQAAGIYGKAATRRNDNLLAKQLDGDYRLKILRLRRLMLEYGSAAIDVEYALAGGGTIHIPMWASVAGKVEDTLFPILTASGKKPKPMVVSQVTRELTARRKLIEETKNDPAHKEFFKYEDAKKAMATMDRCYKAIVTEAKAMSRTSSDRLLGFCYRYAKE